MQKLATYEERLAYLSLNGKPCAETFGAHRYLNQNFYKSHEWRTFRDHVIARDYGRDLGVEGHEIPPGEPIYIHHINTIDANDIIEYTEKLMDMENVICTSFHTHQLIHYGDTRNIACGPVERTPNDTCPWKR